MSVLREWDGTQFVVVGGMGIPFSPIGCSVHKNGTNQTGIPLTTFTKVTFGTKEWDQGNYFDTTNNWYKPLVPGKYLLCFQVEYVATTAGDYSTTVVYKNGVGYKYFKFRPGYTNNESLPCSCFVNLNGSTDYIEIYTYHNFGSAKDVYGGTGSTYFQASLIPDNSQSFTYPMNFTGLAYDKYLEIGQSAYIDFSGSTSVPLRVACVEGLYELDLIGDQSVSIGTLGAVVLLPNNTTVTAGDIDVGEIYVHCLSNSANTGPTPNGSIDGVSLTSFSVAYGIAVRVKMQISTFTKSKNSFNQRLERRAATDFYQVWELFNWLDLITAWTSLGTITFPFAQSGKIVIKRVV